MKTSNENQNESIARIDWALLYMRLFAGGIMLFHNIGKIQNYNEIISSYPTLSTISAPALFVIVAVAEVILASLIILGWWVRSCAALLTLGILGWICWQGVGTGESRIVWLGLYLFLFISGSGAYGFDSYKRISKQGK